MNVDRLNPWITLLANVGVILGIIFLALQIQQGNEMLRQEQLGAYNEQTIAAADLLIADPSLIEIMLKERHELTELESERLYMLGRRMIVSARISWLAGESGNTAIRQVFHRPKMNYGMPEIWADSTRGMEPEFAAWFKENIVDSAGT